MRYHYVVSNIVLFALLQVHQNQQIVVLQPWLCGSVNLTANENIHHEEERTSFFCCSARFRWSRHQPGYAQEGQEVGRDYLLLGIHVRRIPSDIVLVNCGAARRQGSGERMMERRPAEATEVENTSTVSSHSKRQWVTRTRR